MPNKPNPPNPDKDRRAFLRSVLLDSSSTQAEREAALREYDSLSDKQVLADLPAPAQAPARLPQVADFLPKEDPHPGSIQPAPIQKLDDYEEVIVHQAKPARYGPPTAPRELSQGFALRPGPQDRPGLSAALFPLPRLYCRCWCPSRCPGPQESGQERAPRLDVDANTTCSGVRLRAIP